MVGERVLMIAAQSALHVTRAQQKTKASMFEAYIAGLYYAFLGVRGSFGPPSEEGLGARLDDLLRERGEGDRNDEVDETMSSDAGTESGGGDSSDHSIEGKEELGPRFESSEPDNESHSKGEKVKQEDEGDKTKADTAICSVQPQNSGAQEVSMPSRNPTASFKSAKSHLEQNDEPQVADHPTHHPPQASEGTQTHDIQFSHGNHPARPTRGQAYDHIDSFLRPLFAPLARWALQCMRDEQSRLFAQRDQADGLNDEDGKAAGYLGVLNLYVREAFRNQPVYTFEALQERFWRARCVAVDDKGEEL
jgi:hypothetical protein